jgi:hypothetical protein
MLSKGIYDSKSKRRIKKEKVMAFSVISKKSGKKYYLHTKEVELTGGRKQKIYYFAGEAGENALKDLPEGYEVVENAKTGLPLLKRKK